MTNQQRRVITLTEYQPQTFAPDEIPESVAETLWRDYRSQIAVEFPSVKTNKRWQLTSQGWVGFIPISRELGFSLQPKVPLHNLFRMLEVAFDLQSFHLLDKARNDLFAASSLLEFYTRLAHLLAQRVLDRCRRGIHHAYLNQTARLPYVRGEMQMHDLMRHPTAVTVACRYEEHTADIVDNQIIAWALHCILHSGLCTDYALPTVRKAYRTLQNAVTLRPFSAQACRQHLHSSRYNRLNHDYRPLHALSAFFLAESGPSHQLGDRPMIPFVVDMARLYERFVAQWLKANVDSRYRIQSQERHTIGRTSNLYFNIDLVLYDRHDDTATERVRLVMDTKYKLPNATPSTDDIAQVVTYAEAKGAHEAILIYPMELPHPLDEYIGNIRVRSLAFPLNENLSQAGHHLLNTLEIARPRHLTINN